MKKTILLLFLFFSIFNYSQMKNFDKIDKFVSEVPKSETLDIETLSTYLKKNAKTKKEIVQRIYFWIAQNIQYDWDAFINKKTIDVSAISTLENRKSVCAGYANLFKAICDNAKIKCVIIEGYAKGYGYEGEKLTKINHAWNAVKLYDKWELIDSTWGSGLVIKQEGQEDQLINSVSIRYLFDDPNDFILEHLPEDEEWQLLEKNITIETFYSQEMEIKRKTRTGEL